MTPTLNNDPLTGHYHQGNYVWGIGMQLAWAELRTHLAPGDEPRITPPSPEGGALIRLFEASNFGRDLLSPEDYYAKADLGPSGLDTIRREVKAKFPSRSIDLLPSRLDPGDAIAFSYVQKGFAHRQHFVPGVMTFNGQPVQGFHNAGAANAGVRVLNNRGEADIAIKLLPQTGPDEIFLIKGFGEPSAADVLAFLAKATGRPGSEMKPNDELYIPDIQLDVTREYSELLGTIFAPKDQPGFQIAQMKEQIKFSLDFKGAHFENEALVHVRGVPQQLYFDQPFWLVMKEADKDQPYFMLRVENDAVLRKGQNSADTHAADHAAAKYI